MTFQKLYLCKMSLRNSIFFSVFMGTYLLIACSKDPTIPSESIKKEPQPVLPKKVYSYLSDALQIHFNSPPLISHSNDTSTGSTSENQFQIFS